MPSPWWPGFAESAATWRRDVLAVPRRWRAEFDVGRTKYEELYIGGRWVSGPASMMGVLGRRHLEVDHSRVLAWLLEPRGRHGLGTALLRALFADLSDEELAEVSVVTEEPCGGVDASGFVDIIVRTRDSTMVIENKVWAGQHGKQLDVYYDAYFDDEARFVFLTPGGARAHSDRPEVEAAWRPMSWRRDVIPALAGLLGGSRVAASAAGDYLIALREEFRV